MRRRRSREVQEGAQDLEEIYDRYAPAVLGYFRTQRMADPEGLTGDVFVSVARALDRFDGDDGALRRWVFTIAHNRRVDAIRRAAREPRLTPIDDADDAETATEDVAGFDPELADALAQLTDDQRQAVVLRHVADLAVADVAAVMGRSHGSVKMLTTRGLEALAGLLDAPGGAVAEADDASEEESRPGA